MTKTFFLLLFLINLSLFPKEVKKDLPFDTFHKGVNESFQTQKEILFGFNAKRNSMPHLDDVITAGLLLCARIDLGRFYIRLCCPCSEYEGDEGSAVG